MDLIPASIEAIGKTLRPIEAIARLTGGASGGAVSLLMSPDGELHVGFGGDRAPIAKADEIIPPDEIAKRVEAEGRVVPALLRSLRVGQMSAYVRQGHFFGRVPAGHWYCVEPSGLPFAQYHGLEVLLSEGDLMGWRVEDVPDAPGRASTTEPPTSIVPNYQRRVREEPYLKALRRWLSRAKEAGLLAGWVDGDPKKYTQQGLHDRFLSAFPKMAVEAGVPRAAPPKLSAFKKWFRRYLERTWA